MYLTVYYCCCCCCSVAGHGSSLWLCLQLGLSRIIIWL